MIGKQTFFQIRSIDSITQPTIIVSFFSSNRVVTSSIAFRKSFIINYFLVLSFFVLSRDMWFISALKVSFNQASRKVFQKQRGAYTNSPMSKSSKSFFHIAMEEPVSVSLESVFIQKLGNFSGMHHQQNFPVN